jgi:2-polyprenyl-3-methyl-5-hydroxy-6-metoxy-1,4-benzoquinol methylase
MSRGDVESRSATPGLITPAVRIAADYPYPDVPRGDILAMIPADGKVIGSVGCGSGCTEGILAEQGREVHGVDISAEAVEAARGRLASARLISPDDRVLFPNNSLDGLILADVIEHIPAAWDALALFAQAVKPGGWVVISVPNMQSIYVLIRFMILGDWPERPRGIFDRTHVQMMSRRRLIRWIDGAGLDLERWFDAYGEYRWRGRVLRALDRLTLRLFHDWLTYQWQCVCRKKG